MCVYYKKIAVSEHPYAFMSVDNDNIDYFIVSKICSRNIILCNIHTPLLKNKTVVVTLASKLTHVLTFTMLKSIVRPFIQDLPWDDRKPILLKLVHYPLYKTKDGRDKEKEFIFREYHCDLHFTYPSSSVGKRKRRLWECYSILNKNKVSYIFYNK